MINPVDVVCDALHHLLWTEIVKERQRRESTTGTGSGIYHGIYSGKSSSLQSGTFYKAAIKRIMFSFNGQL